MHTSMNRQKICRITKYIRILSINLIDTWMHCVGLGFYGEKITNHRKELGEREASIDDMKFIIIGIVVVFILVLGFFECLALIKTPEEKECEDQEQMEYLKKWREENEQRISK